MGGGGWRRHPPAPFSAELVFLDNFAHKIDVYTRLPALPALPPRVSHGDLKFNNILFAPPPDAQPICLVDLDTVGPMSLAFELGDPGRRTGLNSAVTAPPLPPDPLQRDGG